MEYPGSISLNIPETNKPRVIIIGGGFGGLSAIKALRKAGLQVVVFDKQNYNTFHPLLYQVATAGLQPDSIAAPLRKQMWQHNDFHFRMLAVDSVDTMLNIVYTTAGALTYDYLIIATGSRPNFFGNKQLKEHSLPLKTIPDALNVRSNLMQMLEQVNITTDTKTKESLMNIVIVGGGPTGVEMAGALAELRKHVLPKDYPEIDFSKMNIYLVEGQGRLLPTMSAEAGGNAYNYLDKMGIRICTNTVVAAYDGNEVVLKNGDTISSRSVIWSAGVKGNMPGGIPGAWVEKGKLRVDDTCRVVGSGNVFAIGDIALLRSAAFPEGLPGVAQPAMQMGAYVGKTIMNLYLGRPIKPFKYFDKGSLATIGRAKAVADFPGGLKLAGRITWFIWLFIHISYLVSFRNKLLVFANWCWNFCTYEKGNRLIIRPFVRKGEAMERQPESVEQW